MKRISQSTLSSSSSIRSSFCRPSPRRCLHNSPSNPATVQPITHPGLKPAAPTVSAEHVDARVARRRKQADLLARGQDLRAVAAGTGGGSAKTKRFWKDVHVVRTDGLQVHLDKRPLRRPNKTIITIPHSKPHLATAIALEWDLLVSAQQALKHHLIPLTSLVSRALDIHDENTSHSGPGPIRTNLVNLLMKYLDTDSLLCWAETPPAVTPGYEDHVSRTESLRSIQQRTAGEVIAWLTTRIWPGVKIVPVLDEGSIMPKSQPPGTREVIQGWVMGLNAWDLAGFERGVLAGKGVLGAARLVGEWSEALDVVKDGERAYGVEEAAKVASLEVDWQIGMWGAVEDTHDVEREDIRRQLGSVILLVSGKGTKDA